MILARNGHANHCNMIAFQSLKIFRIIIISVIIAFFQELLFPRTWMTKHYFFLFYKELFCWPGLFLFPWLSSASAGPTISLVKWSGMWMCDVSKPPTQYTDLVISRKNILRGSCHLGLRIDNITISNLFMSLKISMYIIIQSAISPLRHSKTHMLADRILPLVWWHRAECGLMDRFETEGTERTNVPGYHYHNDRRRLMTMMTRCTVIRINHPPA